MPLDSMVTTPRDSFNSQHILATKVDDGDIQRQLLVNNLINQAVSRVLSGKTKIIVVDGRPGIGKTSNVEPIAEALRARMIEVEVIGTDQDLVERDSRDGLELIEFHTGEMVREAVWAKLNPQFPEGVAFDYMAYSSQTGKRDDLRTYKIPGREGVLIVEGVRAAEHVIDVLKGMRSEVMGQVLFVLMDKDPDLINLQRCERDVRDKPDVTYEEAMRRIMTQERHLRAYFGDLYKALKKRGRFEDFQLDDSTRLSIGTLRTKGLIKAGHQ